MRGAGPGLTAGEVVEVTIEKGVYRGLGLARHEGQVVFVPRAFPGDRLRVRVESAGRDFARALALDRVEDGPGRRTAPCPSALSCGGCAYQELGYGQQLALKARVLGDCLARAGAPWRGEIIPRASPEQGWRSRCTFHVADAPSGLRLGLREQGSHRIVDLDHCPQLSAGMNGALREIRAALAALPRLAGRVHGVELAESYDGKARVAALVVDLPPERAAAAVSEVGELSGLSGLGVVSVGQRPERFLPLRGEPFVTHVVAGLSFRAHVRSFFQANRHLVEPLVETVARGLPPGGRLLDLYAGIGFFALALAAGREEVHAIEADARAAEDARENVRAAALGQVRVRHGDVLLELQALPPCPDERIVLDPPRTGAGRAVIEALTERRPASIVYVSCDPPTLGRDLAWFAQRGYRPASLEALDLFPDTYHLECVVELRGGL
jgi:23S rRNA (uracil1939-C5)-methyltransferase